MLRPAGVFLLAGTALRAQTRTARHVARMNELAAGSASLALAADAELSDAVELQAKSAADSDAGLALQSESAELEAAAEGEFALAAAETALGDGHLARAEALHEEGARDALASEALLADAEELRLESERLRERAKGDRAAAALDGERSAALSGEAARSGGVATGAEERAAGYEALAMKREGQSARDGEALLRTEAGAAEDAEVVAACTPIPLFDFICDAIGAIVESGQQGIAAFEGAKAAVESLSAVVAQRKERAQLVLAIEKEEEAARLAAEAGEFQGRADEEGGRAALEEAEGAAAGVDAGKDQLLGDQKAGASEREEALAALDEEKATEEYAEAARDESIASEEESSAIASQIESEELLEESTSEELDSLNERFDGESKESKAENMMKESIGHGVHALGFVLYAIVTAGLVVYIVLMRGLTKIIVPGVARVLRSESTLSTANVLDRWCRFILHVGVVTATIASMPSLFLSFKNMPVSMRTRALLTSALVAGVVESLGVHTTHAVCCCHEQGSDFGSILSTAVQAFLSNVIHLVPVVLMELLIITTIFGPGVFSNTNFPINPVWIWCALLLLVYMFMKARGAVSPFSKIGMRPSPTTLVMSAVETRSDPNQLPVDDGEQEHESSCTSFGQKLYPPRDIAKEYGSMEDVSLLSSSISNGSVRCENRTSSQSKSTWKDHDPRNVFDKCSKAFHQYCERLRPSSDLLVLSLVVMLLWRCWPLLRILYPLAKTSLGKMAPWISLPVLLIAVAIAAVIVHFLFVH